MTCRHRDDVAALLLGALAPDEALATEAHLLQCDDCSAQRRDLAIVRTLLDHAGDPDAPAAPADLGDEVVARLTGARRPDRRRDLRLVLLGAAAAVLLTLGAVAAFARLSGAPSGQALELVTPGAAPKAWAVANLHRRVDGTIVDLEAGDLPLDGAAYSATVRGPDAVLATQRFTVNSDGWAQILLATSRPMRAGDVIEVTRLGDGTGDVPVLRCHCAA